MYPQVNLIIQKFCNEISPIYATLQTELTYEVLCTADRNKYTLHANRNQSETRIFLDPVHSNFNQSKASIYSVPF